MSCVNRKDCPTIGANLTRLAAMEIHSALPSVAGVRHARGMANWKTGSALICIKDYDGMKQGDKGVIIALSEGFFSNTYDISYKDGAKKCTYRGSEMDKYFAQI